MDAPAVEDATPRGNLTRGPIARTLLAFAMPTLGSNILQSLNGSINAIWAGRFLGADAIAATSNANIIQFVMFALLFGFGMAATVLIGQAYGRHDIREARRILGTTMTMFFFIALAVAVIGYLSAPSLLRLLGTPGEVHALAKAYLRVIFIGMPPGLLLIVLTMALRGAGDSVTPLLAMILNVAIDAGLNPVLILGLGPAPRMGIAGAATATAIAAYVTFFGMLAIVYARDLPLRLRGEEWWFLRPDWALVRPIIVKGVPMGLQMVVMSISGLGMMGLVNRGGAMTAAAYGVAQQLWTYIQMPAIAIGAAASAMAAQCIGAGLWERVARITRVAVVGNLIFTGGMIALMLGVERPILALFVGYGSPTLPIAQHINALASWAMILLGVSTCLFGTMRATGAVIAPLVLTFIGLIPLRLGFVLIMVPRFGQNMLWLSFPFGSGAVMLLAIATYLQGGWKRHRMIAPIGLIEAEEQSSAGSEAGGRIYPTA